MGAEQRRQRVELLAPAGDIEKLKIAILYGADAVYTGYSGLSLRAVSGSMDLQALRDGIDFVHSHGKKIFVAMNIFAKNEDVAHISKVIRDISKAAPDGVIVSDPGVFSIIKAAAPELGIHISTQANCTNYAAAAFWHGIGAKRIVLARELSFAEIAAIRQRTPADLELEMFVHGAMCVSYSGRCLLSNYLTGRDANKGECAQPCRWKYHLVEEKRPEEYLPVLEDGNGTYIFNSKDLCLLEHLPEVIESGVSSIKIEGRMKSAYYVATVVSAYRAALDDFYAASSPADYMVNPEHLREVSKASHREFTTGFAVKRNATDGAEHSDGNEKSGIRQNYKTSSYIRDFDIIGIVQGTDPQTGLTVVEQRNRFFKGDAVEVMVPMGGYFEDVIAELQDEEGNDINSAPHPQMKTLVRLSRPVPENAILRKKTR